MNLDVQAAVQEKKAVVTCLMGYVGLLMYKTLKRGPLQHAGRMSLDVRNCIPHCIQCESSSR
jgi:hypothetical protein